MAAFTPGQAQAVRARFRITLNGFKCNRPTNDDALQRDGVDDEVYLAPVVFTIDKSGRHRVLLNNTATKVIGDTNDKTGRLRGGSGGNVFGGNGGFKAGDGYPTRTPWVRNVAPNTGPTLPMLLFEGELVKGENAVVIVPSIWEWDGSRSSLDAFFREFPFDLAGRVSAATKIRGARYIEGTPRVQMHFVDEEGRDRPVGMNGEGYFYLKPYTFTYDIATQATQTNSGVISVRYSDTAGLGNGDYTVYLQVEQSP